MGGVMTRVGRVRGIFGVAVIAVGATCNQAPAQPDYNAVASKNVVTLPSGTDANATAFVRKVERNVVGGVGVGQREVYEWHSPPSLTSAAWAGGWVGHRLAPGRVRASVADGNGDLFRGPSIPQGYRGNLALLPAWVPPTLFPRAARLGDSSEPLIPAAMYDAPTGWQARSREVLHESVDLMTGTPLVQVTDLRLPVAGATFQLTRTRSSLHGNTFPTIGSDGMKFTFDATDRVWDWLGSGWMIGENPILLIDDTRADVVGDNPPTCWLILDAHRSIPFQWIEDIKRYEAPPRFRARLTYTQTSDVIPDVGTVTSGEVRTEALDPSQPGDQIWITPPKEIKVSLYDGALTYTFAVVWEDVQESTWESSYLSGDNSNVWVSSSLHDRPFLPEHFAQGDGNARPGHSPWDRTINRGLGIPYYALLTRIEDRNGVRAEIFYTEFEQRSMDSPLSDVHEVIQDAHKKGKISHVVVSGPSSDGSPTLELT